MTRGEIGVVRALAFALDADGIGRTPCSVFKRPAKCGFKSSWFPLSHQPAHCAFGITRRGVDQKSVHWPRRIAEVAVKAFAQRCASIAAIKTQLIDEHMSQRVKQHELCGNVAVRLKSCCARRVVMGNESDKFWAQARHGRCPFCDFVWIDLQKDSFAVNLDGWQPVNLLVKFESLEAVAD